MPASAILLKMAEEGSGLYAFAPGSSSVIGKLRKGQTAYLKVETFPAYEWGAAKGHIESLSLAPDEKGNFPVRVAIDEPRKLEHMLQAGMTGTVNIQLSERTFFQYFFRNLKKIGYEMSGE